MCILKNQLDILITALWVAPFLDFQSILELVLLLSCYSFNLHTSSPLPAFQKSKYAI
jgi:hypothetical protein